MKEFKNGKKKSFLLQNEPTRNEIEMKYIIKKSGFTQSKIAAELGMTTQSVNQVIKGRSTSLRILLFIENLAKQINYQHKVY